MTAQDALALALLAASVALIAHGLTGRYRREAEQARRDAAEARDLLSMTLLSLGTGAMRAYIACPTQVALTMAYGALAALKHVAEQRLLATDPTIAHITEAHGIASQAVEALAETQREQAATQQPEMN
jgi:hypothetical protein